MVVASDQRVNATVFSELDQVVVAGIGGHNPGRVVRIRQPDRLLLEAPAVINLISDFRHKFKWSAVSRSTEAERQASLRGSATRAVNPARDIQMAPSPALRAKVSGAQRARSIPRATLKWLRLPRYERKSVERSARGQSRARH